jgi:hypothetical protein
MKAICPLCGEISQTRYQYHLHVATSHEHEDIGITPCIAKALLAREFVTYGSEGFVMCIRELYNSPEWVGRN